MNFSLPSADTTVGKMFLSIFDKAVLGVAIAIAGFFVSEYWRASTVGARIIEQIPAKLHERTGDLTLKIPEIATAQEGKRNALVRDAVRQIDEIGFLISLGDGLSSAPCKAKYLDILEQTRLELATMDIAKGEEMRQEIVESFPSVVECIKNYQRSSVGIAKLF
jgi:hypothetical protein